MPAQYWAEALATATYLLNRRPYSAVRHTIPYTLLHNKPSKYFHLRVFGCLCYPNLTATARHKLSPRSTACVFLGYPSSHKWYRCLDMATQRVIISRHVVFDETCFSLQALPLQVLAKRPGFFACRYYSAGASCILAHCCWAVTPRIH